VNSELKDLLEIKDDYQAIVRHIVRDLSEKSLREVLNAMENAKQVTFDVIMKMRTDFPHIEFNEPPDTIPTIHGYLQPIWKDMDDTPDYYEFVHVEGKGLGKAQ